MAIATRLKPLYEVKLIADGKQHFYQIGSDETYHPGVTTILGAAIPKPALLPWSLKMMGENVKAELMNLKEPLNEVVIDKIVAAGKQIYKKVASDAADLGSRAHKAIDNIIKGETPIVTEDIAPCVEAFREWNKSSGLTIELGDTRLGSRLFGYGGSLDMLALRGNDPVLIDLKTSKGIWPEMGFQISAYAKAFQETFGVEVKEALILRVGKDKAEFEVKKLSNLNETFQGFLAALKLYSLSKFRMFDEVEI